MREGLVAGVAALLAVALAGCARNRTDLTPQTPPLPELAGRDVSFRPLIAPTQKQKECEADLEALCPSRMKEELKREHALLGAAGSDVVYLNDAPMGLSSSVQTRLSLLLASQWKYACSEQPPLQPPAENAWTFAPSSLRYQLTYGEDSTLYVMARERSPNCTVKVKGFDVAKSDRIFVYYGPDDLSDPMPGFDSRIADPLNPPGPDQRIYKLSSACLITRNCSQGAAAPTQASAKLYWVFENRSPLLPRPAPKEVGNWDGLETPGPLVLRRIVIRKADGSRAMIRIDTPCAAFKLCVRNTKTAGCNDETMCLLRPEYTLANRHCLACAADPTGAK